MAITNTGCSIMKETYCHMIPLLPFCRLYENEDNWNDRIIDPALNILLLIHNSFKVLWPIFSCWNHFCDQSHWFTMTWRELLEQFISIFNDAFVLLSCTKTFHLSITWTFCCWRWLKTSKNIGEFSRQKWSLRTYWNPILSFFLRKIFSVYSFISYSNSNEKIPSYEFRSRP